jgi:endoglucanase
MKKCRIIAAILFLVFLTVPAFAEQENLVKNGDFKNGYNAWFDYKNDDGSYIPDVENNMLKVKLLNPGLNPWSIAVGQSSINLVKGMMYTVKFSAKGDTPNSIKAVIQKADAPYTNYSGRFIKLTKDMKDFTFSFTMKSDSEANSSIQFQMGTAGKGEVYITNVSIVNMGAPPELVIPTEFPKPFAPKMMRGVNFGNTLDAPNEGEWGPELRPDYFDIIKNKGIFDTIRIPCRWETHSLDKAPYTIDPVFMKRVDWAVSSALNRGFYVMLNMHHHLAFEDNPMGQKERWLAMWKQVAEHFAKYPDNLMFELYNEPGSHQQDKAGTLEDEDVWNKVWPEAFRAIRESNPQRTIVISGPHWASPNTLTHLEIPADIDKDTNKIMQFHFYYPENFCFQGAQGSGFESTSGIRWKGSKDEKDTIKNKFYIMTKWAKQHNYKLWNGEFTSFPVKSVPEDRLKWIGFIVSTCEENGIPWCYWDFANDQSRLYNPDENTWDDATIKAIEAGMKTRIPAPTQKPMGK